MLHATPLNKRTDQLKWGFSLLQLGSMQLNLLASGIVATACFSATATTVEKGPSCSISTCSHQSRKWLLQGRKCELWTHHIYPWFKVVVSAGTETNRSQRLRSCPWAKHAKRHIKSSNFFEKITTNLKKRCRHQFSYITCPNHIT